MKPTSCYADTLTTDLRSAIDTPWSSVSLQFLHRTGTEEATAHTAACPGLVGWFDLHCSREHEDSKNTICFDRSEHPGVCQSAHRDPGSGGLGFQALRQER